MVIVLVVPFVVHLGAVVLLLIASIVALLTTPRVFMRVGSLTRVIRRAGLLSRAGLVLGARLLGGGFLFQFQRALEAREAVEAADVLGGVALVDAPYARVVVFLAATFASRGAAASAVEFDGEVARIEGEELGEFGALRRLGLGRLGDAVAVVLDDRLGVLLLLGFLVQEVARVSPGALEVAAVLEQLLVALGELRRRWQRVPSAGRAWGVRPWWRPSRRSRRRRRLWERQRSRTRDRHDHRDRRDRRDRPCFLTCPRRRSRGGAKRSVSGDPVGEVAGGEKAVESSPAASSLPAPNPLRRSTLVAGTLPPARQSRPIEEPRTTRAMTDKEAGFEMWPQLAAGKHVVRPATPRRPYDAPERSRARAIVPSRAPRARATD